jgi:hypothetical protein
MLKGGSMQARGLEPRNSAEKTRKVKNHLKLTIFVFFRVKQASEKLEKCPGLARLGVLTKALKI